MLNLSQRMPSATSGVDYATRLSQCLAAARSDNPTPHDLFAQVDDNFWLWANTLGCREHAALRDILPGLPDETTQANYTGLAGDATLKDGFKTYQLVKQIVDARLGGLSRCQRMLDFGCGWGRIIRFYLRDLAPEKVVGIDCMPEAIELCKAHNRWCRFNLVAPMPPTSLEAGSFDFAYAFSVYSHLSETACRVWIEEFHRLLKPGGLVIVTTRDRHFIQYCQTLRNDPNRPAFAHGGAASFEDTQFWLDTHDRGGFCHSPSGGGGALAKSFYGETVIPRAYVESHWSDLYALVDFINDRARCEQNVIVLQKK